MQLEMIVRGSQSDAHTTPVLFVHGMWHGAWCWEEYFLPYFAEHGYQAHALSLRGHGESEGRKGLRWTSLADYVSDVRQAVEALDMPPVLVGHSMGGMVVQKYLEEYEAPAAVLLASPSPKGVFVPTLRVAGRHPLVFLRTNLTLSMYPVIGTPSLTREAFFSEDMPDDQVAEYFSRMQDESYRAYLDMMMLNRPCPKKVQTPMLVLGAAGDGLISTGAIEATARAYSTQAEIFPDMAHDMMLERGWQAVADKILQWFSEQDL